MLICCRLLYSQQTVNFQLDDSLIIHEFQKVFPRSRWKGSVNPLFCKGYYILQDSVDEQKAYLKNFFTKETIPFNYGKVGKALKIVYNLKTKKFENEIYKVNKWKIKDIIDNYPLIYVLIGSYKYPQNFLFEFNLENKSYKLHQITKKQRCGNCYLSNLDLVNGELWIYGWNSFVPLETKTKFCIYSFTSGKINKYDYSMTQNLMLYENPLSYYINTKSRFLWNGNFYPVIRYNTPTQYLFDLSMKGITATFTNPHHGFADFEQLQKGPISACGGVEVLKYVFNYFQYSGILTFDLEGKQFFCQQALSPVKITNEMLKDNNFNIPLKYYLTIWDDSLNIVADIPLNEQLIDISEAGAFTIRYDGDDAVIYRYRIEFSENSLNENTQR